MPRQLLRDGTLVADDWVYATELNGLEAAPAIIVAFEQWVRERQTWLTRSARLGVILAPADKVETLAPDLSRLSLIGADFGGPGEGRGYTQARLLRERYAFDGELRAVGYVRQDLVFIMARCGFNSFELPANEVAGAQAAFNTFTAEYQSTNDRGLKVKPQYRSPGRLASA